MLWLLVIGVKATATLQSCITTNQIYYGAACVNVCPDNYYRNGWECMPTSSPTTTQYSDSTFTITLPPLYQTVATGGTITLGTFALTTAPATVTVSINAYFGAVTLASTTGLTFNPTPYVGSSMTFSGTLANVNSALTGMTYTESAGLNYVDPVAFTFNDGGSNFSRRIIYNVVIGTAVDPRNCELSVKVNGQICNGHGWCDPMQTTAACTCYYPYYGSTCTKIACPQGCMDLGGTCSTSGTCTCNTGYSGTFCQLMSCLNNCNGNGVCDQTSGVCSCYDGYFGQDCSLPRCVDDCNGHGRCVSGVCSCYTGYFGTYCDGIDCPRGCGAGGGCDYSTGLCTCTGGYVGNDCMYTQCPNSCTSAVNGSCDYETGICSCNSGYAGVDCSYTA